MTSVRLGAYACGMACLIALNAQPGLAQGRRGGGPATAGQWTAVAPRSADPMAGPLVTGAPFSADAATTVVQTLGDGTRIEQHSTAKFYRDGTGRVRREQTIIGLDALNPSASPATVVTFDSVPGDPMPYVLDPVARTARQMPRGVASSTLSGWLTGVTYRMAAGRGGDLVDTVINFQGLTIPRRGVPNDLRPTEESLGTRQLEGVKATGIRTTTTIPQGRIGNDRPIQITDERWESAELGVLILSRYSDPRTGVVEFKLTNISRTEPRADLFSLPSDYTVVQRLAAPGLATPRGGSRGVPPAQRPPQ